MSRRRASIGLLAGLALALAGCGAQESAPEIPPTSVSLALVRAVDLVERIDAAGELVAKEQAEIAAEVEGRITEVPAAEGSPVDSGTALLTIAPERRRLALESATAELDEARASLAEAERELLRIQRLREVASKSRLEQAETALSLAGSRLTGARARVGVARRALEDARVRAPFPGLIARRLVSRGEYVNVGTKLFELVSLDPVEVEFHVPERDSSRVQLGQTVDVQVSPYPDETFRASVSVVAPTIDVQSRTLRVKGLMANADGRLRPGLFARVDLGVAKRPGVAMVPEGAVLRRADGAVVFRFASDHRVERVVIDTGVIRDGVVEVVSGLAPGELVVARGHNRLVDGELVVPRDNDGNLVTALPNAADPES